MVAVIGLSMPAASEAVAGGFASATNLDTGVTTTSVGNPDGSRTVTTTTSVTGVAGPAVPAADTPAGDFASSTDINTGVTTTSAANPNGTHTVTDASNVNASAVSDDAEAQGADPEDYLLDTWLAADPSLGFRDWLVQQENELAEHYDWTSGFEEWGDDDWDDRSDEEKASDRLASIASWMAQDQALREKWQQAETDQSFEDWHDETLNGGNDEAGDWSSDFEEWGDDDWDDSEDTETGALNPAPQQNAIQNATAVAIQAAQHTATRNATSQAVHAAAQSASHAAAEAARPYVAAPRLTLVVRMH
jgi:hypothetical protein